MSSRPLSKSSGSSRGGSSSLVAGWLCLPACDGGVHNDGSSRSSVISRPGGHPTAVTGRLEQGQPVLHLYADLLCVVFLAGMLLSEGLAESRSTGRLDFWMRVYDCQWA